MQMKRHNLVYPMLLAAMPIAAYADAFLPTMISANVLWLLAFPLIVALEGWMMKRWGWTAPYKNSFWANFWSMIAAIPIGILLSYVGVYLGSKGGQAAMSFLPTSLTFNLAQVFLYGNLPAPSYGYINGISNGAGISLAGLVFIGICWLITFAVEGRYYRKRNPSISKASIYRGAVWTNLASYSLLLTFWLPYSYMSAVSSEATERRFCQSANTWSSTCLRIWARYPELKTERIHACEVNGIDAVKCVTPPPGLRIQ
jgi:hypothetical protein